MAHPPQTITPNDHGGYILIATALLTTWSILFLLIRGVVRRIGPNRHIASDDIAAIIATVLGCMQASIVMVAVDHAGLGNRKSTLGVEELHRTGVLLYASRIVWPLAVGCSKIAMTELTARLGMHQQHLIACRIVSIMSGVWGIASMLAVVTRCHSKPWDGSKSCSALPIIWILTSTFDILTEICIFLVPLFMVLPLTMPRSSKIIVLIAFGSRLPLIPVIIIRLINLLGIRGSTDYTWDLTAVVIMSQLELHYGLYAMTLPCLRPLLKTLNTGMLAATATAPPDSLSRTVEQIVDLREHDHMKLPTYHPRSDSIITKSSVHDQHPLVSRTSNS